ncbi:MAG: tyrosine-type recombinase/integrase [Candidatus Hodarchaeota archaeon]
MDARIIKPAEVPYEDLPTEAEVLKMAQNVDRQRDRALILLTWETGASPIEILNLTVGNVTVNRYGAVISFPRYVDSKVKEQNQLKTEFRYRRIPVATSVPDLLTWLSMHPKKNAPSSPLFPSAKGGGLSYIGFYRMLEKAKEKAGINKRVNPYSLRHLRLTQVSEVLSPEELKEFAGHSKYSNVTPRYISVSKKRIAQKIYRERGIKVEEETLKETPLTVKVCPRCKAKNSPTANFCGKCSSPINLKIALEVQKHADALYNGSMRKVMRIHHLDGRTEDDEYGFDLHVTKEVAEILYPLMEWMETHPERFEELKKQMWINVASEVMANTNKANP